MTPRSLWVSPATFPWPPASRGLFDIGPVIGLFVTTRAVRLALLGRRAGRGAVPS